MKKQRTAARRTLDILVVDDDPMIGLLLQGGMDEQRFSVSVTDSGAEAIAMCQSSSFDFVVVDYQMPGKSGLDVASTLHGSNIPFVMLSAFADSRIEQEAARQGALGYLIKPVTPRQVELAIDTGLARAEEIRNLARAAEVSGTVGVAIGLVMVAFNSSRTRALDILRAFCRPENRTLKDVSWEIANLFELHLSSGCADPGTEVLRKYLDRRRENRDLG